jgi:hypothetical protein
VAAPLVDDHPGHVSGLAVEVIAGPPRTDYLLGDTLEIQGQRLAAVPVAIAAPNDIVATAPEKRTIAEARIGFGRAVRAAFAALGPLPPHTPAALVVRHRAQRDEDNTWATWIAAVCGARGQGADHWAAPSPLAGWAPTAVASVTDERLTTPVVYELWGSNARAA